MWWQKSLLPSKKRKQRRQRNDSESPCQEPGFIFSSLYQGTVYEIVLFTISVAWKQNLRSLGIVTWTPPNLSSTSWLLAGGDGMGQSPTCHPQGKDTHSQTSGPQTSWDLQTPCFCLALFWNRKVSNPIFLTAKNHGTFLWEIQFKKDKL